MKKNFKKILIAVLLIAVAIFLFRYFTKDSGYEAGINDAEHQVTESEGYDEGEEAVDGDEYYEIPEGYGPLTPDIEEEDISEDTIFWGEDYTDVESVSAYIYEWHELPPNFITKNEAKDLGWVSSKGNLHDVAPWASIGGDKFGNREGILPEGEDYRECDVNYEGGFRGSERLVYSIDDYDIYYTDDHYETFSQVYDCDEGYVWEDAA